MQCYSPGCRATVQGQGVAKRLGKTSIIIIIIITSSGFTAREREDKEEQA